MCGIIAATSNVNQVDFLLDCLTKMEYRGYDSAGIALNVKGDIKTYKKEGRVQDLKNSIKKLNQLQANCGIGHIRWATHGKPTKINAHPHVSLTTAVVHNGIIENFYELKQELIATGFEFTSDTDTEVIAHLFQLYFNATKNAKQAFERTINRIKGAYAIALIEQSQPDTIYVAKLKCPLVIGKSQDNKTHYVSSDTLCLGGKAEQVMFLQDNQYAIVKQKEVSIYNEHGVKQKPNFECFKDETENTNKGEFKHFMVKEIYEQSKIIENIIDVYIEREACRVKSLRTGNLKNIDKIKDVTLIGCGTAYHSALLGQYYVESIAKVKARAEIASEYKYRDIAYKNNNDTCIAFSQSGETADTMAAIGKALENGQQVGSILNSLQSSIARASGFILPVNAGAEISVASTKSFTAQSLVVLCFAIHLGKKNGSLSREKEREIVKQILSLPQAIRDILENQQEIKKIADYIKNSNSVLFLGRNYHFPIALEGSLKLKEISYIHAEAYPSGEMKHGPIALINENLPVIVLAPKDKMYQKSISNMQEVASRNGKIILLSEEEDKTNTCEYFVKMPEVGNFVKPIAYTIPLQLIAYYTALNLGRDIDKPRNLAKSVTVE